MNTAPSKESKREAVYGILALENGDAKAAYAHLQQVLAHMTAEERGRLEHTLTDKGLISILESGFREVCGEDYAQTREDVERNRKMAHACRCFSLFDGVQAVISSLDCGSTWACNAPMKVRAAMSLGSNYFSHLRGAGILSQQEAEKLDEMLSAKQLLQDYTHEYKLEFLRLFLLARDRILELHRSIDPSLVADWYVWELPDIHREVDILQYAGSPVPNLIARCGSIMALSKAPSEKPISAFEA